MKGFAQRKVLGGKLVQAAVEFDLAIQSVAFSGDFFLHPEETLLEMEKTLLQQPVSLDASAIEKKIGGVLQQHNAELIGASPADFALVVLEAIQSGKPN